MVLYQEPSLGVSTGCFFVFGLLGFTGANCFLLCSGLCCLVRCLKIARCIPDGQHQKCIWLLYLLGNVAHCFHEAFCTLSLHRSNGLCCCPKFLVELGVLVDRANSLCSHVAAGARAVANTATLN